MNYIKQYRNILIAILVSLLVGGAFGRWITPEKIEIVKEQVEVEIEKVVEKKVYVTKYVEKKTKKTVKHTKKITKPDGTVIEETSEKEEDTSVVDNSTKKEDSTDSESTSEKSEKYTKKVKNVKRKWHAVAMVGVDPDREINDISEFENKMTYGAMVDYKLFGPISVGVYGTTAVEFGLTVGLDF